MGLYKVYKTCLYTLLVSSSLLLGLNCGKNEGKKLDKRDAISLDTVAVKAAIAERKDIKLTKTFTATLEGEDQANVVSKIPERITSIKVKVGDKVDAGQILITLDKSGASSQYYQAQAGFLNAQKDYKRMEALYGEGAISQQMLDGTKTAYDIAKANFEAAKNTVELTAPISGIVTAINPNIGDLANPGFTLITIASINRMKALFDVGEADVPNFAIGQPVEVYSELKPELVQRGSVSQISKSADIQSRSFELRALFPNTGERWFKPGMFCRVNVQLKAKTSVLTVPNDALVANQNNTAVYVISDGRVSYRPVKMGITDGTITEILEGLKDGEAVATVGVSNLKDGSIIHVSQN